MLAAACAQAPTPDTAGFVYRLGRDTVGVSSVTWTGGKVSGVYVNRVPATTVVRWNADVDADGGVQRLERTHTSDTTVTERFVVTVKGDRAVVEHTVGDSVSTRRFVVTGLALPRSPATDPGLLELHTRHLVTAGLESVIAVSFGTTDTMALPDTLRRVAPDTVVVQGPRLRIDSAGHILNLGANAERTTLDIEALATAFGPRPLGELSPRDTVTGNVGDATVSVAYGRPKMRGRDIFGALVPWDAVWRTGANNPTFLTTDKPIVIGTARVPAGTYTLWTIPAASAWTLILSRNIGENAGAYDSTADFARTAMQSGRAAEVAEQLTIVVEGGQVKLTWDNVTAAVPLRR